MGKREDEIRAHCDAATNLPMRAAGWTVQCMEDGTVIGEILTAVDMGTQKDVALAASAREYLLYLLARVDRLERQRAELREELDRQKHNHPNCGGHPEVIARDLGYVLALEDTADFMDAQDADEGEAER